VAKVDLTGHLTYIRKQGGPGCWGYATLAIWDVLNEMTVPNPPNLSMNLWLMLHARRDLWTESRTFLTPDGRYRNMAKPNGDPVPGPEWGDNGFFQTFGITTEGTEPHIAGARFIGGFTDEGVNEARYYRLAHEPTSIAISTASFKAALNASKPIRLESGPHVIAILGYDDATQTFTYVDSAGDQAYPAGGFSTFSYAEIDAQQTNWLGRISNAFTIEVIPPPPVPVAEIWVEHAATRLNLNLWLSAEGSAQQKRKIWPPYELLGGDGQPFDTSRTLHYRVPLPRELIWPPEPDGCVVLDLYDSNAIVRGPGGGQVKRLRAAWGHHVIESAQVSGQGPIAFGPNGSLRLTIP
jgi:hypothetical protein